MACKIVTPFFKGHAISNALSREDDLQWLSKNDGEKTWSPYDVLGHLIHGERTDWIPRAKIIIVENIRALEAGKYPKIERDAAEARGLEEKR